VSFRSKERNAYHEEKLVQRSAERLRLEAVRGRSEFGQSDVAGSSRKKDLKPSQKRELVPEFMQRFGSSQRRAQHGIALSASQHFYRSIACDAQALTMRTKENAHTRVHYMYRRINVMVRMNVRPVRSKNAPGTRKPTSV
jgi:hypothetical protein